MEDNKKGNQIDIQLSEEVAQGTYSNLAVITHSSSEFVVDFVRIMPGVPKADVKSRIILTPEHAKRLMLALQDNISKFESMNGPIKSVDGGQGPQGPIIPMGFGPTGQA
ncbi:DUF3467 domain-containing protein [Ancylomarina euxinus]|uniref:DUF3467 domain-containing protein n=1 Tax=Ancylomarina euxinus TaxID=2283627 RepID=A0A425Y6N6_9BACT|nr:DUF3467 domain-containing protein [Ancylomarina euxinus]MCZ4693957.1 DUF3467 domain-containing protein [Ancylomarina euxinus]MUP14622.1 DUF3467 domain-containing protein [Ancylomarina euxinus]RRG24169.1 DUF3467 domain-containing protein [Ancylomarina euxinus]